MKDKKTIVKIIVLIIVFVFSVSAFTFSSITDEEYSQEVDSLEATADNSIVVSDYSELFDALSGDNDYTYIYLSDDITQPTASGIPINTSKNNVVIDGKAPGNDTRAVFTQYFSGSIASTIQVVTDNATQVEIKNMEIIGNNYYGFVSVHDYYSNVTLKYDNILYSGPQLTYNSLGTSIYNDCEININGAYAQEVAETANVIMSGKVSIDSSTTGNAVFWLKGTSTSFTVQENAEVSVNTANYFIYAGGGYPVVEFQTDSSFSYTGVSNGFLYSTQQLDSLSIASGATVSVEQSSRAYGYGFFRIRSSSRLDNGSSLIMKLGNNTGYAFEFTQPGATAFFDNPNRVNIYEASGSMFNFVGAGNLKIETDSINYWTEATGNTISIDDQPTYMWNKQEGESLDITSSIRGTVQSTDSNFDINSDPTDSELNDQTFDLSKCKLLIFGKFELSVSTVTTLNKEIAGVTELGSDLLISYPASSGELSASGSAKDNTYAISINEPPLLDGTVTVLAHCKNLKIIAKATVIEGDNGSLSISHYPQHISFGSQKIPNRSTLYKRVSPDFMQIEVEDTRPTSGDWTLLVAVESPFTQAQGDTQSTLPGELVYVSNGKTTVLSNYATEIYSASGSASIIWKQSEGIMLQVYPGGIYSHEPYKATINWVLQDSP